MNFESHIVFTMLQCVSFTSLHAGGFADGMKSDPKMQSNRG